MVKEWGTSGPPTSGPPTSGPPTSGPRHLDPRYCTVYNTVEAGVQMSNFGNKVGHLDPRHLDPWYSTVYKTVGGPDVQFWKQSRTSGPLLIRDASQVCS